jgi:hypothetical protein
MKMLVVVTLFIVHHELCIAYPGSNLLSMVTNPPPTLCRDFDTIKETSLPICDFVMTDKLKTNLLSLLITEQKNMDLLIADATTSVENKKKYIVYKKNLMNVEKSSLQKISDICNLKGRIIPEGSQLVIGCIYNQLSKIKDNIEKINKMLNFQLAEESWSAAEAEKEFDVFINEILFNLAEKNKATYPENSEIKSLMLEILKIYEANGHNLYAAIWGICGLEALSKTPSSSVFDVEMAVTCEEKYLMDLRQTLFLAI